jgi:hypothetical protein
MQSLAMEYRTQLDLHALGITALQVFIDMLPQQSVSAIPEEIRALKVAWDQYWRDASRLWEPLYHAFERKTDWMTLRQTYIANEAHNIIDKALGRLRRALCNARDACAHVEPDSKVTVIFSVLAELISQGAKPLGREAAMSNIKLASWSGIAGLLNSSLAAPIHCDSLGRRGSTTTLPRCAPSSTTLPMKSKLHATTSTPVHTRGLSTTPTMVISGPTTILKSPCMQSRII